MGDETNSQKLNGLLQCKNCRKHLPARIVDGQKVCQDCGTPERKMEPVYYEQTRKCESCAMVTQHQEIALRKKDAQSQRTSLRIIFLVCCECKLILMPSAVCPKRVT